MFQMKNVNDKKEVTQSQIEAKLRYENRIMSMKFVIVKKPSSSQTPQR